MQENRDECRILGQETWATAPNLAEAIMGDSQNPEAKTQVDGEHRLQLYMGHDGRNFVSVMILANQHGWHFRATHVQTIPKAKIPSCPGDLKMLCVTHVQHGCVTYI